jgi:hypothetical protein
MHKTTLAIKKKAKVKRCKKPFINVCTLIQQKWVSSKEINIILENKLILEPKATLFKILNRLYKIISNINQRCHIANQKKVKSSLSVIAPAKTGNEISNKKAVINTDQTNKGNRLKYKPGQRILKIVTIKFIAPAIEEIPAICKLKMAKSTPHPE